METLQEAREKILAELISADANVRAKFREKFLPHAEEFLVAMANAVAAWRELDVKVSGNEKLAYVSALVFTALTLHILSMKLFLLGQQVAAGNAFRRIVESIALSLVCSGKELNVLDRFIEDKYSPNDAIRDVLRHFEKLGLMEAGVKNLSDVQSFYHKYSHPTKITITDGNRPVRTGWFDRTPREERRTPALLRSKDHWHRFQTI